MLFIKLLSIILFVVLTIVELFPMPIQNLSLYLFILWIISSLISFPKLLKHSFSQQRYLFLFFFLAFYFVTTSLGKNLYQGLIFTLYMMRVISPIVMYDIIKTCSSKIKKIFATTLLLIFVIYAIWMYQLIDIYGGELGLKNSVLGVGVDGEDRVGSAFGYVYSLPILILSLILYLRIILRQTRQNAVNHGWKKFTFYLVITLYLLVLVVKSLFMTAIVLTILSICLGLFYKSSRHWIMKSLTVLLSLIIVFLSQYQFIATNISRLGSESTDQRVEEIYYFLTGQGSKAQDLSMRSDLSGVSIRTFFGHPIFGANHLVGFDRFKNDIIGNHAEWFDMLALYGIFALLLFSYLYKSLKYQYYDTGNYLPAYIYILIGFLNPMFYFIINLTVFVIAPLLNPYSSENIQAV